MPLPVRVGVTYKDAKKPATQFETRQKSKPPQSRGSFAVREWRMLSMHPVSLTSLSLFTIHPSLFYNALLLMVIFSKKNRQPIFGQVETSMKMTFHLSGEKQ